MSLLQIHEPGESPAAPSPEIAIGIDLGTTNSVAAYFGDGKVKAIKDREGNSIVPSALYFAKGTVHIGKDAFDKAAENHTYPLQSIKRLMGKSAKEAYELLPQWAAFLKADASELPVVLVDGTEQSPITLSAEILKHIRSVAEQDSGGKITKAVITVPAYFDDAARQATRQAATLAGMEVLRLINEPTAAAVAYGLEQGRKGVYAVYDLGGGTFDVSILRLEQGVFQVLATGGDTALGGDDIDMAIARVLADKQVPAASFTDLLQAARSLKELLGAQTTAEMTWQGQRLTFTLAELKFISASLIKRSLDICKQVLEDAEMTPKELDGVVLVGGSTRLQAVRDAVERFFTCPIYSDLDPDRVVAYGAAIQAHALTHGSDHLLLDVTPLSLGLETMGGIVEKLIYRNTPIPATAAQEFTTYQDGQTGIRIHVLQGERELVDQCRSLARFELTGIPPLPAGVARVEVRFTIDADGLLMVTAQEKNSAITQTIEVRPSYGLPMEKIEAMILEGMRHGKEDMLARLLIEERVDAARTLEELRSALAQDAALLDVKERVQLEESMKALTGSIATATRDRLHDAHMAVKAASAPFAEKRMNHAIQRALSGKKAEDLV